MVPALVHMCTWVQHLYASQRNCLLSPGSAAAGSCCTVSIQVPCGDAGPRHCIARAEKRVGHIAVCGACLALCLQNLSQFIFMQLSNIGLCFSVDSLPARLNCYRVAMRGHRVLNLSCIHADLCPVTQIASL